MSTEVAKTLLMMRHSRIIQEMAMVNNQAELDTHHRDGWRTDWSAYLGELAADAKAIEDRLVELYQRDEGDQ